MSYSNTEELHLRVESQTGHVRNYNLRLTPKLAREIRYQFQLLNTSLLTEDEHERIKEMIWATEREAEHFIKFKAGTRKAQVELWQVSKSMKNRFCRNDILVRGVSAAPISSFKANQIRQHSRQLTKTDISSAPEKSKLPQPNYDNETLAQGIFG